MVFTNMSAIGWIVPPQYQHADALSVTQNMTWLGILIGLLQI